jgi:hypothetical protein
MNEHWAGIVISIITALSGVLGIFLTQRFAKSKANAITSDRTSTSTSTSTTPTSAQIPHAGDITPVLHALKDGQHDIIEHLRGVKMDLRHGISDIRLDIERIERP